MDRLRISDDDRHRVAEVLRAAAGDGRIDLSELDERLEATYAAKTYADLVPITVDLPHAPARVSGSEVVVDGASTGTAAPERFFAVMSGFERRGVWQVPERMVVTCIMGGAELDLRAATFAAREVTIIVNTVMGGAQVIVGPDVHVVIEGVGIMGGYSAPQGPVEDAPGPDAPRVRVKGVAIMGGVSVTRKHPR